MALKDLEFDYHQLAEDNQAIGLIKIDEKGIMRDDWNGGTRYTDKHELKLIVSVDDDNLATVIKHIETRIYKNFPIRDELDKYGYMFNFTISDHYGINVLEFEVGIEGIEEDGTVPQLTEKPVVTEAKDVENVDEYYRLINNHVYYKLPDKSDLVICNKHPEMKYDFYRNCIDHSDFEEFTNTDIMTSSVCVRIYIKNDKLREKIKDHFMKYLTDIDC